MIPSRSPSRAELIHGESIVTLQEWKRMQNIGVGEDVGFDVAFRMRDACHACGTLSTDIRLNTNLCQRHGVLVVFDGDHLSSVDHGFEGRYADRPYPQTCHHHHVPPSFTLFHARWPSHRRPHLTLSDCFPSSKMTPQLL
ncbi:hypothetical protein FRC03_006861 [Tulasnella sp. 419]|nr:hypothetical protein FRC03_006861 [Tulasnella sp. 419]